MAVVFVEGFDTYNGVGASTSTSVGMAVRWQVVQAGGALPAPSLITGRFGGQAFYIQDGGAWGNLPASYTSGCFGAAINFTQLPGTGSVGTIVAFTNGGGGTYSGNTDTQFSVVGQPDGSIAVKRYSTVLGQSVAGLLIANTWAYIEIEFVISATVGQVRVYLNNNSTPVINLSGVNNKNQAGYAGVSQLALMEPGLVYYGNLAVDDMYVTDSPNRLGEQRVVTSYPNSDVLTTYWSSSSTGAAPYTMIDETTCDGDTTYVSSNTVNSRIVTGVSSLPVPPVDVNAVQITGFARKDETQLRQLALEYQNTAGTVATGPTYTLGTDYKYTNALWTQNPLTGSAWTDTDVNNMRIGARVVT